MAKNKKIQSHDFVRAACGVVGVFNHPNASQLVYLGLYSLQHRGQESAGIVASNGTNVTKHLGMGLVSDVFNTKEVFEKLQGSIAIGHNRYSTTGASSIINIQPIVANTIDGPLALAHNGNLVNAMLIRNELEKDGSIFQTTTDTEVVLHLIARSKEKTLAEKILEALRRVHGAYSFVFLAKDTIFVARDPRGFRPLCIGKKGEATIFASETCALDLMEAEYVREVQVGELIQIDSSGMKSFTIEKGKKHAHCIFEFVYFSRPDSKIFGETVDKTRRKLGKTLAKEWPADADIVISVPDSSNTAALGFSRRTGIKFELGLIRNHYIGRTFIAPDQSLRDFNVKIKFNPVEGVLKDRNVVIVEDSIVRGTTLKKLVKLVKQAGAKQIHVRVSSPPIKNPCFYGMDFPTREELIANFKSVEEIRTYLGVDTLGYLSMDGMVSSATEEGKDCGYCTACFGGEYPLPIEDAALVNNKC